MAARPWCLLLSIALSVSACATSRVEPNKTQQVEKAQIADPVLVGKRCKGHTCHCRSAGDNAEVPPPPEGNKRIEIRMSAMNGKVMLDSPTLGHFEQSGPEEACYYINVPVGKVHDFHLDSQERSFGSGVTPNVSLSEYGPAGPYWYKILEIACGTGSHGCDPVLAREWGESWLEKRKRGRLEACGSMVVSGLNWNTSGGQAMQNGGLLRDFFADFSLDVKRFATQFPPGASECQIGH
jgi:hypothetical protein